MLNISVTRYKFWFAVSCLQCGYLICILATRRLTALPMGNREWLANFDDIMTAGCVWFHIVHNAWLQADMIRGYQTPNFSLPIYQIDIKFGAMWLFVQYLIQSNNKENIKDLHCRPIVRGIHWYPVDYPHKGASNAENISMSWYYHDQQVLSHLFLKTYDKSTWCPVKICILIFNVVDKCGLCYSKLLTGGWVW